ncbi:MAG: DUF4173 domain-containing protein [Thermoflexales bacterium]
MSISQATSASVLQHPQSRLAAQLLAGALALGALGSWLLQANGWGIGFTLFMGLSCAAVVVVWRVNRVEMTGGGRWLLVPLGIFAIAYVLRDSDALRALNLLAAAILLALFVYRARSGQIRVAGISDYVAAGLAASLGAGYGALVPLATGVSWSGARLNRTPMLVLRAAMGVLIALPMLLIFGALFASADPDFGALLSRLFKWDLSGFLRDAVWFAIIGWMAFGLLKQLFGRPWPGSSQEDRSNLNLKPILQVGAIEAIVALGLFNLMFAVFVAFQLRYLFSLAPIGQTPGMDAYADYARRGFFELVAVAALTLPTLLAADWLTRPEQARWLRALSLLLIGLLFVIMASALQRMNLYTQVYGLTELRIYTTAFMLWLGAVFLWYAVTVVRGRRPRFAFGALVAGLAAIVILNFLNPDAAIVRVNASRSLLAAPVPVPRATPAPRAETPETRNGEARNPERPFDASYAVRLSADAVPALIDAMIALPAKDACYIRGALVASARNWETRDWRAFHLSRFQAVNRIDDMPALGCPPK